MKEGITTIKDTEYYFDGYIAYPIKCKCGGDIIRFTQGTNFDQFNYETRLYDISVGGDTDETNYECNDCQKEHDEMTLDPKSGKWI